MSQASETAEPTMEEILASIRRIIADDETEGAEDGETSSAGKAASDDDEGEDLAAWNADASEDDGGTELSQDDLDSLFDDDDADEGDAPSDDDFDGDDLAFAEAEPDPEPEPEPEDEAADLEEDEAVAFEEADEEDVDDVLELSEDLAVVEEAPSLERLVSHSAESLVLAQLGLLSNLQAPSNGRTLEDLVTELLRPMMKMWLDENLPPLVENMVREEIERISKGRR